MCAVSSESSRAVGVKVAPLSCPYHPDAVLMEDYHAGDMICPECGLVVGDRYCHFALCLSLLSC